METSQIGIKVKLTQRFSLIYNGFYYLFLGTRLSRNPSFSAWWLCTFSSIFYIGTAQSLVQVLVLHKLFDGSKLPNSIFSIILLGAFAILADRGGENSWFGISASELDNRKLRQAKVIAISYLLGGWLIFITTAIALYSN